MIVNTYQLLGARFWVDKRKSANTDAILNYALSETSQSEPKKLQNVLSLWNY